MVALISRLLGRGRSASGSAAAEAKADRLLDEGNALEDRNDPGSALVRYEAARDIAPNYVRVHINAGNTYAYIYAPEGDVHSHQTGQNFGSVICSLLCWRQTAQGHYDEAGGPGGDIVSVK